MASDISPLANEDRSFEETLSLKLLFFIQLLIDNFSPNELVIHFCRNDISVQVDQSHPFVKEREVRVALIGLTNRNSTIGMGNVSRDFQLTRVK